MRQLEAGVPFANVDAMLQREKELFVQSFLCPRRTRRRSRSPAKSLRRQPAVSVNPWYFC
jgi:hypothetical protein